MKLVEALEDMLAKTTVEFMGSQFKQLYKIKITADPQSIPSVKIKTIMKDDASRLDIELFTFFIEDWPKLKDAIDGLLNKEL